MRYPKYQRYLDAFGALSVLSAIAYWLLPAARRPEEHLDGLWGNLSSEMIGIWLSVRLIDLIIRSHESATKARVRVVRNLRYVERLLHGVLDFRRPFDLNHLFRELDWINSRMPSRRRHLKEDEKRDVEAFYAKLSDLLSHFPPREVVRSLKKTDVLPVTDDQSMSSIFSELEAARRVAEKNILEETDEDDGM
jgi:hypothetical protein